MVGILLGYLAGYLFIDSTGGWRYMFGLSAIPTLALGLGMVRVGRVHLDTTGSCCQGLSTLHACLDLMSELSPRCPSLAARRSGRSGITSSGVSQLCLRAGLAPRQPTVAAAVGGAQGPGVCSAEPV